MTLKYINTNLLKDYNTSSKDITITSTSGDYHNYLNFSINFDKTTAANYINAVNYDATLGNISVTQTGCPANCATCNSLECTSCNANYFLKNGDCINTTGSAYYFLSPAYITATGAAADLPLASQALTTKMTVSFFIKYYANSSALSTIDIFRFGTDLKLKLVYGASTANLVLYSSLGDICDYGDFSARFGLWTHISVAYYYDSAKNNYFPSMLNFQVNFTPQTTTTANYNALNISPMVMVIPKEPIALYAKIYVWNLYYTGSWAFMSFTGNSDTPMATFLDAEATSSCLTVATYTTNCYKDFDNFLYSTNYCANASHYNGTTCLATQTTCPYGYYTPAANSIFCSCRNVVDDMWISQNSTQHYCKSK